jgi:hypothetical protein
VRGQLLTSFNNTINAIEDCLWFLGLAVLDSHSYSLPGKIANSGVEQVSIIDSLLLDINTGLPYLCSSYLLLFSLSSPAQFPLHSLTRPLVFISILFSSIAYWLSNCRPTAEAFFVWIMWLFLDLVAAESLVVLMSSIFPNFVVSLALTAFANGLWMSVGGFLVPPNMLNVFWRYLFHYIDYQVCLLPFPFPLSFLSFPDS